MSVGFSRKPGFVFLALSLVVGVVFSISSAYAQIARMGTLVRITYRFAQVQPPNFALQGRGR